MPSGPIESHGSLTWTYGPPLHASRPDTVARLHCFPPSLLSATTTPARSGRRLSNHAAMSPFELVGSTASDGSPGTPVVVAPVAQSPASATEPLMSCGGGKLGSAFAFPLSQPASASVAARRAAP